MNYGRVIKGEIVMITVPTHKFETGQKINSIVSGYYLKMGADFGSKVALIFSLIPGETGLYYSNIDTSGFSAANYLVVIKATVDTVDVEATGNFEVIENYGYYGFGVYGNSRYH